MDISPDKQNLDDVFSSTRFHIDFYQRDYKWTEEPVHRLLDDVFFKFNEAYARNAELTPSKEVIQSKYPWYYLNTYVTNDVGGKIYVVDGQQRLTTLTLVLIKLLHMTETANSRLARWVDAKIAGQSGFDCEFWMNHDGHKAALEALYRGTLDKVDISSGITAQNLDSNFRTISKWLEKELDSEHKLETFTFFFLRRLVLIELRVEQTDVPMVFEVINDRGVKLRPYEILKGKLLGQINKDVLEQRTLNALWEERIGRINRHADDEADNFFRYWLKAKFADTRHEAQRFDGDYHRILFTNDFEKRAKEKGRPLKFSHSPGDVLRFLEEDFRYYAHVYDRVLHLYGSEEVGPYLYNYVNDLDGAFLLLLSSLRIEDPELDEKLMHVPAELDRLFSLLQLQGAYDSNAFQDALYRISRKIREGEAQCMRSVIDAELMDAIAARRQAEVDEPFKYVFFKQTGINLNARFKRYFFARVEEFLAINLKLNMKHSVYDLTMRTGSVNGFHIEHILAYNKENMKLFGDDEDQFEQERNRLGGILLLKGRDNISSNAEKYARKLKSYANTLYWNETLRADSYKSKLDMRDLVKRYNLDLCPFEKFGPEELERRQKALFQIASIIWI